MQGFANLKNKEGKHSVTCQVLTWIETQEGGLALLELAGSNAAIRATASNIVGRYLGDGLKPTRVEIEYAGGTRTVMRTAEARYNYVNVKTAPGAPSQMLVIENGFNHLNAKYFLGLAAPDGQVPPVPMLFARAFSQLPIAIKESWLSDLWLYGWDDDLIMKMNARIGVINAYQIKSAHDALQKWHGVVRLCVNKEKENNGAS